VLSCNEAYFNVPFMSPYPIEPGFVFVMLKLNDRIAFDLWCISACHPPTRCRLSEMCSRRNCSYWLHCEREWGVKSLNPKTQRDSRYLA